MRVNGTQVPQNANNGWTFDQAANTLSFHGSGIPQPGTSIEVQYSARCLM